MQADRFDLSEFLPYLLNQAAETTSVEFQRFYRERYGMLRTEWRVLFHLGRYGDQTAGDICARSRLHKTKVSRAVAKLEARRFLTRTESQTDRRREILSLTAAGRAAHDDLTAIAYRYDQDLAKLFSTEEQAVLRKCLVKLAAR